MCFAIVAMKVRSIEGSENFIKCKKISGEVTSLVADQVRCSFMLFTVLAVSITVLESIKKKEVVLSLK